MKTLYMLLFAFISSCCYGGTYENNIHIRDDIAAILIEESQLFSQAHPTVSEENIKLSLQSEMNYFNYLDRKWRAESNKIYRNGDGEIIYVQKRVNDYMTEKKKSILKLKKELNIIKAKK